ncbi:MAG: phosphatidate cytidylyltransferase [Myxococcota bacterium]
MSGPNGGELGQTIPVSSDEPIHPLPPTPEEPKAEKKPPRDMPGRLVTAGILVPLVSWVILRGGLIYLGTVVVIILLGQREFYRLIEDKGARPLHSFGLAAGAALPVVAYLGTEYHMTVLMTATLLAVMVAQLGKAAITEALASISGTFFGVFYVGWLLSYAVVLRNFYDAMVAHHGVERVQAMGIVPESGIFYMFFTLFVVVWCDAGAYFGGRAWGRRKLARKISPGKSVEGAVAGVAAGVAGGAFSKSLCDLLWPEVSQAFSMSTALVFGVMIAVAGIVGDLIESLLKRDASVKDTGALLPGTGGVLDRIDSPLLGIPVMYHAMLFHVFLQLG